MTSAVLFEGKKNKKYSYCILDLKRRTSIYNSADECKVMNKTDKNDRLVLYEDRLNIEASMDDIYFVSLPGHLLSRYFNCCIKIYTFCFSSKFGLS